MGSLLYCGCNCRVSNPINRAEGSLQCCCCNFRVSMIRSHDTFLMWRRYNVFYKSEPQACDWAFHQAVADAAQKWMSYPIIRQGLTSLMFLQPLGEQVLWQFQELLLWQLQQQQQRQFEAVAGTAFPFPQLKSGREFLGVTRRTSLDATAAGKGGSSCFWDCFCGICNCRKEERLWLLHGLPPPPHSTN